MKQFQAVTESGTTYTSHNGSVSVSRGDRSSQYFHNAQMKSIPSGTLETWDRVDWKYLESLPFVEAPVVGERLYTYNISEWRISTPMKIVEVL